jgi:hypothetical protein
VFAKLAVVILSFATCGAWLLSLRHERVQALSEATQAQLRIDRKDERLWMLRTKIAQRITPPQIEQMTAGLIDLQPIAPYKALTQEQLALLTDDPPVGPPGLLNRHLLEDSQEAPGALLPALAGGAVADGSDRLRGATKASQAATKPTGSKAASTKQGAPKAGGSKPAKSDGKASGTGSGATPNPKNVQKKPTTPAKPKTAKPQPGNAQPKKVGPTRVAKNESSSQEN